MTTSNTKDIAKSVRQRLLNYAKDQGDNFNTVMVQYILQRLLYRLSTSEYANSFLLKGAWLFVVWNNALHRPTKDVDLLGFGNNDSDELLMIFKSIACVDIEQADGVKFTTDTFKAEKIKEGEHYQGVRITGQAMLDTAKIPLQIDIGFGDAVTPNPIEAKLPSLLDMPEPLLRVYPVYTVIAEKFQAMVDLGLANSRMKDFYDIQVIAHMMHLDGSVLLEAVKATFDRRETLFSTEPLYVFSDDFRQDKNKQNQWNAFKNKNSLVNKGSFADVVAEIKILLEPIYCAIAEDKSFTLKWQHEELGWEK